MQCQPQDGEEPIWLAWALFGDCVYTTRELTSLLFGYGSILCWIFAQMPQLVENWKRQTAESLSSSFLVKWMLGDLSNLIGSVLTHQLPFQVYLACYFVFIDVCLLSQSMYFKICKGGVVTSSSPSFPSLFGIIRKRSVVFVTIFMIMFLAGILTTLKTSNDDPGFVGKQASSLSSIDIDGGGGGDDGFDVGVNREHRRHNKNNDINEKDWEYELGVIISWICTVLYLTSRLPQIRLNYIRRSVDGLRMQMFLCAFFGNLLYSTSILLQSVEYTFIIKSLPFLLGSGGTLVFDGAIFLQSLIYKREKVKITTRGESSEQLLPEGF